MQNPHDEVMSQLTGMAPDVAQKVVDSDYLFRMPEFTFEVSTGLKFDGADAMNGPVVMKFPNLGDSLEIQRLAKALGSTGHAEMTATLQVCILKAPASWYELRPGASAPTLNLGRLPDDMALATLYAAFIEWQRRFR